MPIKDLSQIRRLPRLGKIKLGMIVEAKGKTYPKSTDYFVCPIEVQKVYGEKPRKLDVLLPLENLEEVFPQWYKRYGLTKGLVCKGDGVEAGEVQADGKIKQVKCLGEECAYYKKNQCKKLATLNVILPQVEGFGVYQIDTSSYNSMVNINSFLSMLSGIFGRLTMIPLKLIVEDIDVYPNQKKKTVHVMNLQTKLKFEDIKKILADKAASIGMSSPKIEAPKQEEEKKPEELYSEPEPEPKPLTPPINKKPEIEQKPSTDFKAKMDNKIMCDGCDIGISVEEVQWCMQKPDIYDGKFYCRSCQKQYGKRG